MNRPFGEASSLKMMKEVLEAFEKYHTGKAKLPASPLATAYFLSIAERCSQAREQIEKLEKELAQND